MNKKIVFIVVLAECILAVLLISFFGQAIVNANNNILCREIYFTYEDGEKIEDDKRLSVVIDDMNNSYKLYYEMLPAKTTNREVRFVSSDPQVLVDDTGMVTFLYRKSVTITVFTEDGSNLSDSIILVPVRP
ncbi:MAG: hypothetical protein IJ506_07020 [Clostridia bacterium]|nr:hypothetical protein [Clostridia bacterium]